MYEGAKKYKTLAGAQKYIQSKFDQYAEYFESISPPIPIEAKALFCVNGQLLQGYSVLRTPPAREEVTVSDLLDCLDEADMEVSPPPEQAVPSGGEVQPETPVQAPPELAAGPPPSERKQKPPPAKPAPAAKKKGPLKKRPALVR
ncbi:hypothetical protein [Flavonifractor sp. An10]|uniref:hypothetical protein n=1 Tax=Flavonifractor sp. An10 TaxID=1965537 RepID=UPI002101D038|nr:hypothetical protein [Flavonifractor sp. An10]